MSDIADMMMGDLMNDMMNPNGSSDHRHSYVMPFNDYTAWTTNKSRIPVNKMTDEHIHNTINAIKRGSIRGRNSKEWMEVFIKELGSRK